MLKKLIRVRTALSIEMDGSGGKAEKSNPNSEIRSVGIFLNEANISTSPESNNTGNIVLKGNGGVGYQNLAGVDIMNSSIKPTKISSLRKSRNR